MNIDFTKVVTAETVAAEGLAAARAGAQGQVLSAITALTEAITGQVPLAEMLWWPAKEAAARACAVGTATEAETALIGREAAVTGEDTAALVGRILKNADTCRTIIATLTGLRRAAEAAIDEAADIPAVDAAMADAIVRLEAIRKSLLA